MKNIIQDKKECIVIGATSLCIECIKQLKRHNWKIKGVVSDDNSVVSWLKSNNIKILKKSELKRLDSGVHYLFSIINSWVIPDKILNQVNNLAINYHDSLLPQYAGVNSTSWAIINRESTHGISWHIINEGIDTGDILRQKSIPITPDDTSFSLNLKCTELAKEEFKKLLQDIDDDNLVYTKQDKSNRTINYFSKLPKFSGYLNPSETVEDLSALCRGLEFGIYPNPICSLKTEINDTTYVIEECDFFVSKNANSIGSVEKSDINSIDISVKNGIARIKKLSTIEGINIPISELALTENNVIVPTTEINKELKNNDSHYINTLKNISYPLPATTKLKAIKDCYSPFKLSGENDQYHFVIAIAKYLSVISLESDSVPLMLFSEKENISECYRLYSKYSPVKFTHEKLNHSDIDDLAKVIRDFHKKHYPPQNDICRRNNFTNPDMSRMVGLILTENYSEEDFICGITIVLAKNGISVFSNVDIPDYYINSLLICCMKIFNDISKGISIADIKDCLPEKEKDKIINEWNKHENPLNSNFSIIARINQHIKNKPNSTAIVFENFSISYAELESRTNKLANYVSSKLSYKLAPDDLICVCFKRKFDAILAILAVLKLSGAYVPIDPDLPKERINHILRDTNSNTVLTDFQFIDELVCEGNDLNEINLKDEKYLTFSDAPIRINEINDPLLCAIYTSGTTGQPKAVLMRQLSILNLLSFELSSLINPGNIRGTLWSNIVFDASIYEIFSILIHGGELHILSEEVRLNPDLFLKYICNSKISTLFVPPYFVPYLCENLNKSPIFGALVGVEPIKGNHINNLVHKNIKVINAYGLTETAVASTCFIANKNTYSNSPLPIGRALTNEKIYILNKDLSPMPIGCVGEIYISGAGLARGYLNREILTKERFIQNPFVSSKKSSLFSKLYKTGDLGKWLPSGDIEYIGRNDFQVKIRGYRIELGEIENQLSQHSKITRVCVLTHKNNLFAFYTASCDISKSDLVEFLSTKLPKYMLPNEFYYKESLPLTINGKIDRKKLLSEINSNNIFTKNSSGVDNIDNRLINIWKQLLEINHINVDDNLFDIGANSLLIIESTLAINKSLNCEITYTDVFSNPTIKKLAKFISHKVNPISRTKKATIKSVETRYRKGNDIAVIGIACRFPGSRNVDEFWRNLCEGNEGIIFFDDQNEFKDSIAGKTGSHYVPARGYLDNFECFDAEFFDFSPYESEILDPQQRLFLEEAYHALENAGYDSFNYDGKIGVYGGAGSNDYLQLIYKEKGKIEIIEDYKIKTLNLPDFLCSRVSYKLNLKGPATTIQTACSTGLVALDKACLDIKEGKCDIALIGCVSLFGGFEKEGYFYHEGMILSPDGHCRPFDSEAKGTVPSQGVGFIVIKSLDSAKRDNDNIRAVIKSVSVNNDGSNKIGYSAPSIEGQKEVIRSAVSASDISYADIGYIETHGTGTVMGDPIEVKALSNAFDCDRTNYESKSCAIGSVKSNIGHTDTVAGIAGLIKTILCLENKTLVPTIHFNKLNTEINFGNTPFYVNAETKKWVNTKNNPRHAGVSSFGIGGTNAHVILSEFIVDKQEKSVDLEDSYKIIPISAKSEKSHNKITYNLKKFLARNHSIKFNDLAYSLLCRTNIFDHASFITVSNNNELLDALNGNLLAPVNRSKRSELGFLFSGQGSQYLNMAEAIYKNHSVFRESFDYCCEFVLTKFRVDIKSIIYSNHNNSESCINQTEYTQPALFIVEYSLVKLWESFGVKPDFMLGHSIGEYVAACISGVFSLDDALILVANRGKLIQSLPAGNMLAVSCTKEVAEKFLISNTEIAVINSISQCVISGTIESIKKLDIKFKENNIPCKILRTSHGFHSFMMEPILDSYSAIVSDIKLSPPSIPFLSNITGNWISDIEATNPAYWVDHIRKPVNFLESIKNISKKDNQILLEVGPGKTLFTLVDNYLNINGKNSNIVFRSLPTNKEKHRSDKFILNTLGLLWINGCNPIWKNLHSYKGTSRKIDLPGYPFSKDRYWINDSLNNNTNVYDFLYESVWLEKKIPQSTSTGGKTYLIFCDESKTQKNLVKKIKKPGTTCITVTFSDCFKNKDDEDYLINPRDKYHYSRLLSDILNLGLAVDSILYFANFGNIHEVSSSIETFNLTQELMFYPLLFIIQAFAEKNINNKINMFVITEDLHPSSKDRSCYPNKSTIIGAITVISQEYQHIACCNIDLNGNSPPLLEMLINEFTQPIIDKEVLYSDGKRLVRSFTKIKNHTISSINLKNNGTYLITGGLGNIGLSVCDYISNHVKANFVVITRSKFPDRNKWNDIVNNKNSSSTLVDKILKLKNILERDSQVLIINGDVASYTQMKNAVNTANELYGKVNGVFHCAGIPDGVTIPKLSKEIVEKVFSPKVYGTLVLDEIFTNAELDFFIFCSSLASVLGSFGQISYCAANAFIDNFSIKRNLSGKNFITVNWDAWNDGGMALNTLLNPSLIADNHLNKVNEVIGAPSYLFNKISILESGGFEFYINLNPRKLWFLSEHKISGKSIFPGTAYIEAVYAAMNEIIDGPESITILDTYFSFPLVFEEDSDVVLKITFNKIKSLNYDFVIESKRKYGDWEMHCYGKACQDDNVTINSYSLTGILNKCKPAITIFTEKTKGKDKKGLIYSEKIKELFGLRWQNIDKIYLGDNGALAKITLPKTCIDDLNIHKLHPALLDIAVSFLAIWYDISDCLPYSYKSIKIYSPLPSSFYSHVMQKKNKEDILFDITILSSDGNPIIEIKEFSLRFAKHKDSLDKVSPAGATHSDNSQSRLKIDDGISSKQGILLLDAILKNPIPQVLISTTDLASRVENYRSLNIGAKNSKSNSYHARKLTRKYVKHTTEIEEKLVKIWQDFFLIKPIGIEDDFFDLGGDSLMALQLITSINNSLNIDLPPHLFATNTTINQIASFIEHSSDDTDKKLFSIIKLSHNDNCPTLFMIHPAGGSVYIYRDLSKSLGNSYSLYGIQAHDTQLDKLTDLTVNDLSEIYLEEIRKIQPHGPYYLGGASFGGTVAFDLAQKLNSSGEEIALLTMIDTNIVTTLPSLSSDKSDHRMDKDHIDNFDKLYVLHGTAMCKYIPDEYNGEILFFKATDHSAFDLIDKRSEWSNFAKRGVTYIDINGDHFTVNQNPNVGLIAKNLKELK